MWQEILALLLDHIFYLKERKKVERSHSKSLCLNNELMCNELIVFKPLEHKSLG